MLRMGKETIVLPILFLLIFIPATSALEATPGWESKCLNSSHLLKRAQILNTNDGSIILPANMTLMCNYGCDTGRDICRKWPGDALPSEHFLLFQVLAVGLLLLILFRIDTPTKEIKIFDLAIAVITFSLFAALGLQSYNVIDLATGEAVPLNFVAAFDYGMSFFTLMLFFFLMFKFVKSTLEEGGKI